MILRPKFYKLSYPKPLGLDILKGYLNDQQMEEVIVSLQSLPRKKRRILFPSRYCCRKVWLHYVWGRILADDNQLTWKKVRKDALMESAMEFLE